MFPPCGSSNTCPSGGNILLVIDNIVNPPTISTTSQSIIVSTGSFSGVIETNNSAVNLTPITIPLSNYNRSGPSAVGSLFTLSFNITINSFVSTNGGLLEIAFNDGDVYLNPVIQQGSYNYPNSSQITDALGNKLTNYVAYYSN